MYCLGDMVMEPTIDWEIIDEPELLGTYLVFFFNNQASSGTAQYLTGPPRKKSNPQAIIPLHNMYQRLAFLI